eukprot:CAMPEP_0184663242 /NCGR_PEP_ID=MMETSP0308-20130426/47206_1 /TAXON_ID=38269 /ORGANISM="Gloeochaete witrockiana, Strain SAG 46.84" /LENGTH=144 /DNA_ID=CAMNT_0027105837 /DNA_START=39 /DNA_END=473 /DNA_ORIENTATION=+
MKLCFLPSLPLHTRRLSPLPFNHDVPDRIMCEQNEQNDTEKLPLAERAAISAIQGYRRFISPLTPRSCRFVPSCSEYAILAVQKYGASKGLVLASWRILRCNPLNPVYGYDPPVWFGERAPTLDEELKRLENEEAEEKDDTGTL